MASHMKARVDQLEHAPCEENDEATEQPASAVPLADPNVVDLVLTRHLERKGGHRDRYDAWLGSELVVTSRQPLLDGARALLKRGYAPTTLLTIEPKSSTDGSSVPQPIGELARWTIEESDRDGRRRRYGRSWPSAGARDKGVGEAFCPSADFEVRGQDPAHGQRNNRTPSW